MNQNNLYFNSVKIGTFAEKLFNQLDYKLEPKAYILAIQMVKQGLQLYLEPKKNDAYAAKVYDDLKKALAASTIGGPLSDLVVEFELISLLQGYFQKVDKKNKTITFLSNHYTTEKSFIIMALQCNGPFYNVHYRLQKRYEDTLQSSASLLDAVIDKFLQEATKYLPIIENNKGIVLEDNANENQIIRTSGYRLMMSIGSKTLNRVGQPQKVSELQPIQNLFDDCNRISSLLYEGRECKGKMLLSTRPHPNVDETFTLKQALPLSNHGTIRKLIETCSDDDYLLYNSGTVYGIGSLKGKYSPIKEDLFQIIFKKHYTWILLHDKHEIMAVAYSTPMLTDRPFDDYELTAKLKKTFPSLDTRNINKFKKIIHYATFQKHGTIVVISENAEQEAERLKHQAVIFNPFELSADNLLQFTNIDGAIILDKFRKCHAVGVILDGVATEKGNPSRGARYNSAIRYIESQKHPAMAIVVSEDGMVNII